jgi:putative hemolysin
MTPRNRSKTADNRSSEGGRAAEQTGADKVVTYTAEQLSGLERLKTLLARQRSDEAAKGQSWQKKALAKAVYSVFLDCVGLGVEQEAKELLHDETPEEAPRQA